MSNLFPFGREAQPYQPKESPRDIARKIAAGGSHNVLGKDKSNVVAPGVPTIKDKLNGVFVKVGTHPGRSGIGQPDGGEYDTSGSSGQLRGSRPSLPWGCVWCGKCDRPCDFEEGGMHNLFGKRDANGNVRGYLLVLARCHGTYAQITVSFEQLRQHVGEQILAFPYPKAIKGLNSGVWAGSRPLLALPAPPIRLLLKDYTCL